MIRIIHLTKYYKNKKILDDISLEFPRTGLVAICGPSGCGKTTLLNSIAGLADYSGSIEVEGKKIELLNDEGKSILRLKKYGFIFQDFKLFPNETVESNVLFPLRVSSNARNEFAFRKCEDLLELVGMVGKRKKPVSKLSGGEKQRVAIARSMINDPLIILADEPTGSLDSQNGYQVMKILEKISQRSLVLVVSHDRELFTQFADEIIEIRDGKIYDILFYSKHKKEAYLPIAKNNHSEKRPSIPSSFLFRHATSCLKTRKWRSLICNTVTSLGLIGVGLAITLSDAISTNIKKSYSSIVDESKIMIENNNTVKSIYGKYAASYYEACDLANKYPSLIKDIGVNYLNNFESFFPHRNFITVSNSSYHVPIEGISARHINDFLWLDVECPKIMYPKNISYLNDDEVVMGLTIDMIDDICFELRIERTVKSLSKYIEQNTLLICFDFANRNWSYDDQQIVKLKGFSLETSPCIYHTNHLWNEYMFETRMLFPITDSLSGNTKLPWILKKVYYFQCESKSEDLLNFAYSSSDFDPFILEIAGSEYYPNLFRYTPSSNITRVLLFVNTLNEINPRFVKYFEEVCEHISNPVFGTNGGYSIYPSIFMAGFSNKFYISFNQNGIDETIDLNTSLSLETNEKNTLPEGVVSGHYSECQTGGVIFQTINNEQIIGQKPNEYNEIAISTGLARTLLNSDDVLGKKLFVAYVKNENSLPDGSVSRQFSTTSVSVSGIIENEKNVLYHNKEWTISFFQCQLGISKFNLPVNVISFEIDNEKNVNESIEKLSNAFPQYTISNPMSEVNESVETICGYIEIALGVFSIVAILISTLLLTISNWLHVLENKKDIGLARCIGVNKKESRKFLYSHSLLTCFISFFFATVELLILSIFISYIFANEMGNELTLSFNPLSIICMLILSLFLSVVSSFFISRKITKIEPLETLKT